MGDSFAKGGYNAIKKVKALRYNPGRSGGGGGGGGGDDGDDGGGPSHSWLLERQRQIQKQAEERAALQRAAADARAREQDRISGWLKNISYNWKKDNNLPSRPVYEQQGFKYRPQNNFQMVQPQLMQGPPIPMGMKGPPIQYSPSANTPQTTPDTFNASINKQPNRPAATWNQPGWSGAAPNNLPSGNIYNWGDSYAKGGYNVLNYLWGLNREGKKVNNPIFTGKLDDQPGGGYGYPWWYGGGGGGGWGDWDYTPQEPQVQNWITGLLNWRI